MNYAEEAVLRRQDYLSTFFLIYLHGIGRQLGIVVNLACGQLIRGKCGILVVPVRA